MAPLTRRTLLALALSALPLSAASAQGKLRLEIKESDIDIPARTLHFRLSGGAVSSVDYELFSRTFSKDLKPESPPQQLTSRVGDDFGQTLLFGPGGDVGVLFDGKVVDNQGLRAAAFFTRLRCDASAFPGKP